MEYIGTSEREGRTYTFVVDAIPSDFAAPPSVRFEELSAKDKAMLGKANAQLGSFSFWNVLNRYLNLLEPDRLIIMDLTWLELALCFMRLPCKTSAILFVQYPELQSLSVPTLRNKLKFILKEFKTRFLLRNQMLKKIVLLNGAFSCTYLNERFDTDRFASIPDPVPEITADPKVQLRQEYGIEAGRCIFLFFGSMSARKGVGELVEAIQSLPEESARKAAFIFCGVPELGYAQRYHKLIEDLVKERPEVCLHRDERFVSSTRMRALFEQADWILMPYTRPEYSSGILAHAVAAATPVIGPAEGLVGRQIREHGLGLDVPLDGFTRALEKAVDEEHVFDEPARQAFVAASSPEQFAATLLEI